MAKELHFNRDGSAIKKLQVCKNLLRFLNLIVFLFNFVWLCCRMV
jgi:hypothetical protein